MQIDIAKSRQIDHPLRNDPAISNNDNCVGAELLDLFAKSLITPDLLRLCHRNPELNRLLLHRRWGKFHTTAARPIWLGHNQQQGMAGFMQLLESGNSKGRGSAENELEPLLVHELRTRSTTRLP